MANKKDIRDVRLTLEDIETVDCFKNLTQEQKLELISLVYTLSLALYNSYSSEHE